MWSRKVIDYAIAEVAGYVIGVVALLVIVFHDPPQDWIYDDPPDDDM